MNINELQAGPELDALVAERVMGWKLLDREKCGWGKGPPVWDTGEDPDDPNSSPTFQGFEPSRLIDHTWKVYMEMYNKPSANRWVLVERLMGMPSATFCWNDGRPDAVAQAETMPLAICRAALLAVGGGK